MDILEELWYSNLNPCEQSSGDDPAYFAALRKAAAAKERICAPLPPELQREFESLIELHLDAAIIAERNAFRTGFRPASLISQKSVPKCRFLPASPRGKPFGSSFVIRDLKQVIGRTLQQ